MDGEDDGAESELPSDVPPHLSGRAGVPEPDPAFRDPSLLDLDLELVERMLEDYGKRYAQLIRISLTSRPIDVPRLTETTSHWTATHDLDRDAIVDDLPMRHDDPVGERVAIEIVKNTPHDRIGCATGILRDQQSAAIVKFNIEWLLDGKDIKSF